jgi:hypothetical protein
MSTTSEKPEAFEERFVAFIDILGFTSLVARMEMEPQLFTALRDDLELIERQIHDLQEHRRLHNRSNVGRHASFLPHSDLEASAFSDCYLISDTTVWQVVVAVQALACRLLKRGVLTRGGIVQGKAYHREAVVFGPAVIEAYLIERDVAKYPRIIVTEGVREEILLDPLISDRPLLRQDIDGCWFVNVLTPPVIKWRIVIAEHEEEDAQTYLIRVGEIIREKLVAEKPNIQHLSKLEWMRHHYNSVAAEHQLPAILDRATLKADDEYDLE